MILFITRKHPPSVGGMERLSYRLVKGVAEREPTQVIAWGGSQKLLPLFLIYATAAGLWIGLTQRPRVIHVGDVVLAPLGHLLKILTRRPVFVTAHGLDIVYGRRFYPRLVLPAARQLDHVVCISEHTRVLCLERGFDSRKSTVVPVGIDIEAPVALTDAERQQWLAGWGLPRRPRRLLLTVGRLVRRKGVHFFVTEVMPRLPVDDFAYLIVGDGPEASGIRAAIERAGLAKRVFIVGQLSPEALRAAYALADIFVMPNVPVANDTEGFGIVALEARAAGLPVVASAIEGIVEACRGEPDARLVAAGDAAAFVAALTSAQDAELTQDARQARRARVAAQFGWPAIVDQYMAVFNRV